MRKAAWVLMLLILAAGCHTPAPETRGEPFAITGKRPQTPQAAYALARAENLERRTELLDARIAEMERDIERSNAKIDGFRSRSRMAAGNRKLIDRERRVMVGLLESEAIRLSDRISRYRKLVAGYRSAAATMRSDAATERSRARIMEDGRIPPP